MYCSSFESADSIKSENPEPLAGCWLLNIYSTAWCLQGVTFPARSAGLSTLLQQSRAYAFCYSEPNSQHCQHEQHLMVFFAWYFFCLYISPILPPSIIGYVGGGVWRWWVWAITSQCLMLLQIQDGAMFQVWSSYFWSLLSQAANREVSGLEGLVNVFLSVFCMSYWFAHCRKWYRFHLITH